MRKSVERLAARSKQDVQVLWLAARDRRTPWPAKVVAGLAAGYVFSPIQLIPNFIPVLGSLDDLLVVTCGGWLALKLTPPDLIREFRLKAQTAPARPTRWAASMLAILLWIALGAVAEAMVWRWIGAR